MKISTKERQHRKVPSPANGGGQQREGAQPELLETGVAGLPGNHPDAWIFATHPKLLLPWHH